ncbi:hypothetical protein D3C84_1249750 [compost metagenome]
MTLMLLGQTLSRPPRQNLRADFHGIELSGQDRFAQVIEQYAQACQQCVSAIALGQRLAGWITQQTVDGRQPQFLAGGR